MIEEHGNQSNIFTDELLYHNGVSQESLILKTTATFSDSVFSPVNSFLVVGIHCSACSFQYSLWCTLVFVLIMFSPVGSFFATCSFDETAKLWSTDRVFPIRTFIGHTRSVNVREFSFVKIMRHRNDSTFSFCMIFILLLS